MIGTSVISELIFAFAIFSLLKYFVKLIGKQLWWWPVHLKSRKSYWVIFLIDKIIKISSRYSFCKPHIFYERLDKILNCLYYWKVHSQVWDNFWQVKALLKWWKMRFISHWKLFSFSRYLNVCLGFLFMQEKGLICLRNKQLQHKYCSYISKNKGNEIWSVNRI